MEIISPQGQSISAAALLYRGGYFSWHQMSPRVHHCQNICPKLLWLMTWLLIWLLNVHCLCTKPSWTGEYLLGCFTGGFITAPCFTCGIQLSILPTHCFFLSWSVNTSKPWRSLIARQAPTDWLPRYVFIFIPERGHKRNPRWIIKDAKLKLNYWPGPLQMHF